MKFESLKCTKKRTDTKIIKGINNHRELSKTEKLNGITFYIMLEGSGENRNNYISYLKIWLNKRHICLIYMKMIDSSDIINKRRETKKII